MKNLDEMILQSKEEFQKILEYALTGSKNKQIHEVEEGLFKQLLRLGLLLLKIFIEATGDGNVGETHRANDGVERHLQSTKKATVYFSIFGKIIIERAYYWLKGLGGLCPLDAQLNLPENSYSYLLKKWATLLGVRVAYEKVVDILNSIFGIELWSEPVKRMMEETSEEVDQFYEQHQPIEENEAEIVVVSVDGKGVPIRNDEPAKPANELAEGEKPGKKKMSTVSAVYTIDPAERTPESIITEKVSQPEISQSTKEENSPEPQNKVVRATMEGKKDAFEKLAQEVAKRDPENQKQRVALVDGEKSLRKLIMTYLTGFCVILDMYHVLEYIWLAAHVFYKKGSAEAKTYVKDNLYLLLTGKVASIIASLTLSLETNRWTCAKRVDLKKVISYLVHGQEYMKYDVYLAKGYPIGSGVVEGACRNLVKDRMELAGMRWTLDGAHCVLQMRSIDINGQWDKFWEFKIQKSYETLYGNYGVTSQNIAA